MKDKLSHNEQIAGALNFQPVSRIFLVVKADTRMDNVVSNVRNYAEQLLDLDIEALAAIVTHMDTVQWSKNEMRDCLVQDIGMGAVIFSGMNSTGDQLQKDILG